MSKIIFILSILILTSIQLTLVNVFRVFGIAPNLLLISIVIAGISFELHWAVGLGIMAGFISDIFFVNSFGMNVILYPFWVYLIAILSRKIFIDSNFICIGLMLGIALLHNTAVFILVALFKHSLPAPGICLRIVLLEPLYTAAIFPLVFKVVRPRFYPAT